MSIDQQFIEYIVKAIVDQPDKVVIDRTIDEKGVLLKLTVASEDLGRVIGKRGSTAQSLRALLRALGTKNEARYNLRIIDPEEEQSRGSVNEAPAASDEKVIPDEQAGIAETAEDPSAEQVSDTEQTPESAVEEDSEQQSLEVTPVEESKEPPVENDLVSRTRRELDDLDDLDI